MMINAASAEARTCVGDSERSGLISISCSRKRAWNFNSRELTGSDVSSETALEAELKKENYKESIFSMISTV